MTDFITMMGQTHNQTTFEYDCIAFVDEKTNQYIRVSPKFKNIVQLIEWASKNRFTPNGYGYSYSSNEKFYHIYAINDKTGMEVCCTDYPMQHTFCMIMKSKMTSHKDTRIVLKDAF